MHHGEWMVVAIVAMVLAPRIFRNRWDAMATRSASEAENQRLREEVRALKDRITVLERIATDGSSHLDHEIEALRDRPSGRERP